MYSIAFLHKLLFIYMEIKFNESNIIINKPIVVAFPKFVYLQTEAWSLQCDSTVGDISPHILIL